ncbi:thymidylate synthase [Couchioplanes caeruleus]|uniref:thymidylate synthase n=1 Tax=Couchioplanes caeruleus TaxID=56438 RepID=UPI0020BFB4B7|nr:thymidylate synthase [Couchioplanes caeruleus]UQU66830.1 thymidylate synthase [Couchioplanes caeruleus]
MLEVTAGSANELYAAVCRDVLAQGHRAAPRGMATTEVLGAHLRLTEPRRRFIHVPPVRVLNPAFAVAEALWILSGSDEPWIFTYNRALERYADDGRLQGAYGPRMRRWHDELDQVDHVRRLLARDPDSRQAVIQLYDPQRDTRGHRDVPCTLNYRFFLRHGRLEMHTTMRSNDVWLGLPYDLYTATMLQELMAGWLGVQVGTYHHHVDSLHLYAQHDRAAAAVAVSVVEPSPVMAALSAPAEGFTDFLTTVIADAVAPTMDAAWPAMAAVMGSYRAWNAGERPTALALAATIDDELGRALRGWYTHLTASAPMSVAPSGGAR